MAFFGGGGGGAAAVAKPDAPDYGTLWQQYTGWRGDIGKRYESEIASTRARLSAAGHDPSLIQKNVSELEAKRTKELGQLEQGATAKSLREGFEVASGRAENPYAGSMKGQSWKPSEAFNFSMFFGGGDVSQMMDAPPKELMDQYVNEVRAGRAKEGDIAGWAKTQGAGALKNMEEYYSQYYGAASSGTPGTQKTPEQEAAERAKRGASGGTVGPTVGAAPTGAGAQSAASPWVLQTKEQSPWI